VVRGLSTINGKNILLVSEGSLEKELLTANPSLVAITVKKKYPSTIEVSTQAESPLVNFAADYGYFFLSRGGKVLGKSTIKNDTLPVMQYYQKLNYRSIQSGDSLDYKDIQIAIHFLGKAADLGLSVNTIDITGLNMIALHLKGQRVIFTTEKDTAPQDYQFETIIKQFRIEGKNFSVLDLRFDKPVLQF